MKALTLTQPWATLVAIGAKRIETRGWKTSYRGPIAIHAAKAFPKWAREFTTDPRCYEAIYTHSRGSSDLLCGGYPRGFVIATARLVNCIETELIERYVQPFTAQERAFGDYTPGRYGFLLDDIREINPVPAIGMLGLWEWDGGAK